MSNSNFKVGARISLSVLAASVCAVVGMASQAAYADNLPAVKVHYSDLNLATNEGAQALHRRIAQAASTVCGTTDIRVLAQVAASRKCRSTAMTQAISDVGNAKLAALESATAKR